MEPSGFPALENAAANDDGDTQELSVDGLRLSKAQWGFLALLLLAVSLTAIVNYQISSRVNDEATDLHDQFRREVSDRVSLERQVLTYGLAVERRVAGEISYEELELQRALLERQLALADDEAAEDLETGRYLEILQSSISDVNQLADRIGGPDSVEPTNLALTNPSQGLLSVRIDEMTWSAKRIFDVAENQSIGLAGSLDQKVTQARTAQLVGAALLSGIVILMFVALRKMLTSNYQTASAALRQEYDRYMGAKAEQERAEYLVSAQTEVLEMIAFGESIERVTDTIVKRIEPHLGDIELLFVAPGQPQPNEYTEKVSLQPDVDGISGWTLVYCSPRPVPASSFEATAIQTAARLSTLVIERQQTSEQIKHQANHDALTGLPNRNLLADRLTMAVARAQHHDHQIAVLFLDLDRFKYVNDSLGHRAGDQLLCIVADRIVGIVRSNDTVARFGGDEFVLLLENVTLEGAQQLATRILDVVAQPVPLDGASAQVSASIGVIMGDGGSQADEILRNADVAMYRAKTDGDSFRVFDAGMQDWIATRHEMEGALRHALENDELEAWFQPSIHATTGEVSSFEALVRWRRPDVGLVPPNEFIPLAEELGLIGKIDRWMLSTAAKQAMKWRAIDPHLRVSVNVSGVELASVDFVSQTVAAVSAVGGDPHSIVLEITESVFLADKADASAKLHRLRRLGFRIALDDFGTGYSSLQYLRKLPIDYLKVDRAFVSNKESGDCLHDPTIAASIVELGHALELTVIAEGIESESQAVALREIGIDRMQGYFFGKPMPAQDAENLITQDRVIHIGL